MPWILSLAALAALLGADTVPEQRARMALAIFERTWKPADDPRARPLDDAGWKAHLEALRNVLKAGPAAAPVLRAARKGASPATRAFAAQALALLDAPEPIRKQLLTYNLKQLDSARVGQAAPDFTLTGDDGKPHRLGQYRDHKPVVLIFLLEQR